MYLLQGKLTAKEGKQEELIKILIEASKLISKANGSKFYLVGKENGQNNYVYVTELWETKADHDNSLNFPGVKELIIKAVPILEENPEIGKEINVLNKFN